MATKEEVANAKLALITLWFGVGAMLIIGLATAVMRFWPIGS